MARFQRIPARPAPGRGARLLGLWFASAWLAGCAGAPPREQASAPPGPAPSADRAETLVEPGAGAGAPAEVPAVRRDLALPHGWDTLPAAAFEEALARWNPLGEVGRLDPDARAQLGRALDGETPRALRAVLLLAHSAEPESQAALLARLERRVRPAADVFPAVDVACAAALARAAGDGAAERAAALEGLARGRRPHPLLPVRTECAAAALHLGREGAAGFLLSVLREGTEAQDARPAWNRDATSIADLAFAQWRAAEALAQRVEVARTYRPEQSAEERARITDEIARALAARAASSPP